MTARRPAILDTSVIFASINVRDPYHDRCRALFEAGAYDIVVPILCVAEVSHLVLRDLGSAVEARFVESLAELAVESPSSDDWRRIAELARAYSDFPLGAVDAAIVALAERMRTEVVMTLDHRHFRAIRPNHVSAFTLLP